MSPVRWLTEDTDLSTSKARSILRVGTTAIILLLLVGPAIWSLGHMYNVGPKWSTCNHQVVSYEDGRHHIRYNISYTNPETGYTMKDKFEYRIDELGNVGWASKEPISIIKQGYIPIKSGWKNALAIIIIVAAFTVWILGSLIIEQPAVLLSICTWGASFWLSLPVEKVKQFFGH